jgi:transposase InsO family protein
MGFTIQFESHRLELPTIYKLEFDPNVREFYDQPDSIEYSYIDAAGKVQGGRTTPDFLVVQSKQAGFIECKDERQMAKLAEEKPYLYKRGGDGRWHCPAREAAAAELGLGYEIVTSADINSVLQANLEFFSEHFRMGYPPVPTDIRKKAIRHLQSHFATTLEDLQNAISDLRPWHIVELLLQGDLAVDLETEKLACQNALRVFSDQTALDTYRDVLSTESQTGFVQNLTLRLHAGDQFQYEGGIFTIYHRDTDKIVVGQDHGPSTTWPIPVLERLVKEGSIKPAPKKTKIDLSTIASASAADWAVALSRLERIKSLLEKSPHGRLTGSRSIKRSLRRLFARYVWALKDKGWGILGLLPQIAKRGDRTRKITHGTYEIMCRVMKDFYGKTDCANRLTAYGLVAKFCKEANQDVPSLRTFYDFANTRDVEKTTRDREGPRAAYQHEWVHWLLDQHTAIHGDWPFHICHIDHTQLDIEVMALDTRENLGRPWLTILVDAYTRRILAFVLTLDPPSYRACMAVIDECVKRHRRMPHTIVVDNGKEFHSVYFSTLLAHGLTTPKYRPPAQSRNGAVCERLFGTVNTKLIQNLEGNTRIMKNVRKVTKQFNPKNRVAWTLESLGLALRDFFYEDYDTTTHPRLLMSPRDSFDHGLKRIGQEHCQPIPYDSEFRMCVLPAPKRRFVKLHRRCGLIVNRQHYSAAELRNSALAGKSFEVKYDPDDIRVCYARVDGRWVTCENRNRSILSKWSEKQVSVASKEIRRKGYLHDKGLPDRAIKDAERVLRLHDQQEVRLQGVKDKARKRTQLLIDGKELPDDLKIISVPEAENEPPEAQPKRRQSRRQPAVAAPQADIPVFKVV